MPIENLKFKIENCSGFTLIEVLTVLGILVVLSTLGLLVTLDFYKSYAFNAEMQTLVSMLQKARSQSLADVCLGGGCSGGLPHGLHVDSGGYTIFQGAGYNPADPLNQTIPAFPGIGNNGPLDIVFAQLSGDSSYVGNIQLTYGYRKEIISLNSEGQIDW